MTTFVDSRLEAMLRPLDAVRAVLLRAFRHVDASLFSDREARVLVTGLVMITTSLVLTVLAPLWLLALGPIVLGVPHLIADLRYLAVRPGLHRRHALVFAAGIPLAVTFFVPKVSVGFLAVVGAVLVARTSWSKRATGLVIAIGTWLTIWRCGARSDVVFAHAHNVIAIAVVPLWMGAFGARRDPRRWLLALVALGAGAWILCGGVDAAFAAAGGWSAPRTGLYLDRLVRALGLGLEPRLAVRCVLFFAFAQSVHYGVWLRVVPDLAREKAGMRPFSSSYRALVRDFGRLPILVALALMITLLAWAVVDMTAARDGYLRLAFFHGHIELAALALLVLEGRGFGRARV